MGSVSSSVEFRAAIDALNALSYKCTAVDAANEALRKELADSRRNVAALNVTVQNLLNTNTLAISADTSQKSRSDAWEAVWELLEKHNPNIFNLQLTGKECALLEIRELQRKARMYDWNGL